MGEECEGGEVYERGEECEREVRGVRKMRGVREGEGVKNDLSLWALILLSKMMTWCETSEFQFTLTVSLYHAPGFDGQQTPTTPFKR